MNDNWDLIQAILLILIEAVAPLAVGYALLKLRDAQSRARQEHWYVMLEMFAGNAVKAAEQLGLSGELRNYAVSKFEYALGQVELMMMHSGIRLDLDVPLAHLKAIIEAKVRELDETGTIILPALEETEG